MSDYIDENFELDETDEYWGVSHLPCHELEANFNDIKHLDRKNLPLKNDEQLKQQAGYQYMEQPPPSKQQIRQGPPPVSASSMNQPQYKQP